MPDEYEYHPRARHLPDYGETVDLEPDDTARHEAAGMQQRAASAPARRGRGREANPYEAKIQASIPQPASWPGGGKPPGGSPGAPDEPPIKTWIADVGRRLGDVTDAIKAVGRKMDGLGGRLDRLESRVGEIERTLWSHERRLDALEHEHDAVAMVDASSDEHATAVVVPAGAGISGSAQKRPQSKK